MKKDSTSVSDVTVTDDPESARALATRSGIGRCAGVLSYELTITNISSTPIPNRRNGRTLIKGLHAIAINVA